MPCKAPWWLLFGDHAFIGIIFYTASTVITAAFGLLDNLVARASIAVIFATVLTFIVYVPFIVLLVQLSRNRLACSQIPPGYLIYLLAALQLAHTHIYWAIFLFNEQRSFTNVCAIDRADCTHDDAFLVVGRLFYYSSVTFVSVGYGDISPISFVATVSALPELWSPIFYLGILLGRLVDTDRRRL